MSGKETGYRHHRAVVREDIYRPIDSNGLPEPKTERELAADRSAIAEWSALMASATYSGYKK